MQGVFFRASTRDVAAPLNLNGHAVNLADGSVEVNACGKSENVEELLNWLRSGPPLAAVLGVEELETSCSHPDEFRIG